MLHTQAPRGNRFIHPTAGDELLDDSNPFGRRLETAKQTTSKFFDRELAPRIVTEKKAKASKLYCVSSRRHIDLVFGYLVWILVSSLSSFWFGPSLRVTIYYSLSLSLFPSPSLSLSVFLLQSLVVYFTLCLSFPVGPFASNCGVLVLIFWSGSLLSTRTSNDFLVTGIFVEESEEYPWKSCRRRRRGAGQYSD